MSTSVQTDIKLLVVDDVAQNLVAITALLARPGLTVLTAQSGTEALERLLVDEVAVALVDVQMPVMDGFELAELIRGTERTRHTPLIFLTAGASDPNRAFRGYEAGAVDFLHKPIDPMVLRNKVEVFIELHAQKKRMAAQLEELKVALRMNEVFVAVLGHDLRNPLGAIVNGAELVTRLSTDEKVLKVAGIMQSSAARMTRMIEQLLDVARIRSGRLEMKPAENDLQKLSQSLIDELQRDGRRGRVELSAVGTTVGRFDADRIGAAVSNLLGNALQHGSADAKVRVHVDGTAPSDLKVSVSNEGVIPPATLATMFEPFHASGPHSGGGSGGLGLGLYIVNEFVKAHGGKVHARSNDREGTCIELALPRS
jgi:two-component system sensor histidine kinase/response regulator